MKKLIFIMLLLPMISCRPEAGKTAQLKQPVDTVGFASHAWQMDSLVQRINRQYAGIMDSLREQAGIDNNTRWRVAITPHDDYSYVGPLYPVVLKPVKAKTVFMFGVAHKARQFGLENKLVFDSFPYWKTPYGNVKISELRGELIQLLPEDIYLVSDTLQAVEHSLEAIIPFLQYFDSSVQFVPILVPYMNYERLDSIAETLATALAKLAKKKNMDWGQDFAIVISTDAVHYGDEDWGGQNYAPYGADSAGYKQAVQHEYEIINNCLRGKLSTEKIRKFMQYTVKEEDYKDYKWTWCGRYSVPLGLLTAYYLHQDLGDKPLEGRLAGYFTSIGLAPVPVKDIGMGVTAPAKLRHWVGYAGVGYR